MELYGADVAGPEPAMPGAGATNPKIASQVGAVSGSTGGAPDIPPELSYLGRYNKAMDLLEGQGEQQRKDIAQTYDANRGSVLSAMASRGMMDSSMNQMAQKSVTESEADALARLDEALGIQKLNTMGQYSGDYLGAQSNALNREQSSSDTMLSNLYGMRGGANSERLNLMGRNTDQMLNVRSNFSIQGPSWQNPMDAVTSGLQNWTTYEQNQDAQAAAESAQNQAEIMGYVGLGTNIAATAATPYLWANALAPKTTPWPSGISGVW